MTKKILSQIKNKPLSLFIVIEITLLILTMIDFYVAPSYRSTLTLIVISLNVISLIIYIFICKTIQEHAIKQADISLYKKQIQIQKEYQLVKENNLEITKKIYDKIFNELKSSQFVQYHENEAREYANKLIKENSSLYHTDFCQNKIIDAILYNKSLVAKEYNINFSAAVHIPDNINIEQIDLISLYTNLIDNAIEANLKLPENKRNFTIESRLYMNYLIIKTSNTIDSLNINENFTTTKHNKNDHGLGMIIIKNIVDKYNGTINIDKNNDFIEFNISLELK